MVTKTRVTLEEFLALPESEPPCEYFDGEVVPKVSPNADHGALAIEFGALFREWARKTEPCLVGVEIRHITPDGRRVYLPDVSVTKAERLAGHERDQPMTVTPDVVVEILSTDDRPSVIIQKIDMYLALAVPVLLVVDPDERTIREYRAERPPRVYHEGDTLDLSPVLPGFALDVTGLFRVIPGAG